MITEIEIEGFKSLEKIHLKLGSFNLFVGANASVCPAPRSCSVGLVQTSPILTGLSGRIPSSRIASCLPRERFMWLALPRTTRAAGWN